MNKNARIFVAGSSGLVGSALVRELANQGFINILTSTHGNLDLTDRYQTFRYFSEADPEYVFLAAAKVAGIQGNLAEPVEMMQVNTLIQNNVLSAAHKFGVKKLMFFGSSCIYPKLCPQPIKEEYLLTSALEPSNECYALAKIAGLKLCQAYRKQYGCDFISVMPTNLYGPYDTYKEGGHVIPDMIRKFHRAKVNNELVRVWGNGSARREFLFSDDLARACLLVMEKYSDSEPINIGYGTDVSIGYLAERVAKTVGLDKDRIHFDVSGPVGTPVKRLDSAKLFDLGWEPMVTLEDGLKVAYTDYLIRHHETKNLT